MMASEKRHPLPESDEARHREIPEGIEREKGLGEDGKEAVRSGADTRDPEGKAYPSGDLGRGPGS